jgi:hypothetical protein
MTNSEPESNPPRQSAPQSPTTGIPLPLQLLVAAVLLPASAFLISWSLIIITNNLDVAYALGVSDNLVSGLVIGGSGLITGLVVALVSNRRAWGLVLPPAAGLMAGVAIYLGFVVFESGETVEIDGLGLITIGLGQVIAIVAATRLAGVTLAGVFVAIMAVGVGAAGLIQAIPEDPAEVVLVLDVYTVDETTGTCSGAEELAGVVEGSDVLLLELPQVSGRSSEVGSVVLPEGFEEGGGCLFDLGNPLGVSARGYENIDFLPESDPGVPYSISLEGNQVIVNLHHSES